MTSMMIGAVVQARMSSSRLPCKVLSPLLEKPMLQYTLERVVHAQSLDRVVIATSTEASDDPIEEFCRTYGVACFRGSLDNVAQRFLNVIGRYNLDAFVRICADSPFIDQRIVDTAVELFRAGNFDMVTNTLPRSFPKGQSVEVVAAEAFRIAYARMKELDDFEHVTRYFHTHKDQFRIHNFSAKEDHSTVQLSVDTSEDFKMAEKILRAMHRPHFEYRLEEVLGIYKSL